MKLRALNISSSLCSWILDFLTNRPQTVQIGNSSSSTLTLSTGAPQGCVLSPLLFSLYTYDCTSTHNSNTIIKFADNTTVIGCITGGDETAYRGEVSAVMSWCSDNNLLLNISKTKEMIMDYRRLQGGGYAPIHIDGAAVERVSSFRFLEINISEDLSCSHHTDLILRSARQRLFFLRHLRRFAMNTRILSNFYRCTIESILTGNITAWYGSCTDLEGKALQKVVKSAQHITRAELPALQHIYNQRCSRKAKRILSDPSHPSHRLFMLLPSGRRFRSI